MCMLVRDHKSSVAADSVGLMREDTAACILQPKVTRMNITASGMAETWLTTN